MSRELKSMLEDKDKKYMESTNALAALFRKILTDYNVTPMYWNDIVTRFFRSRYSKVAKNSKDIGQERNNFNRAMARPKITWNNFIRALMIMGPESVDIRITMNWKKGKKTQHEITVKNLWDGLIVGNQSEEDDGFIPEKPASKDIK